MKNLSKHTLLFVLTLIVSLLFSYKGIAFAHCDTLDGPVIKAARKALDTKNANLVLIWVQNGDEKEINEAFNKAIVDRMKAGNKEKADLAFFETLVRIHRAGEGAPYTGIEPAGTELNPAVAAADKAIKNGQIAPLTKLLSKALNDKINDYYSRMMSKNNYDLNDVPAGREFVKSYVEYVHFTEGLYDTMTKEASHHAEGEHEAHAAHGAGHGNLIHNILFAVIGLAAGMGIMYLIKRNPAGS